MITTSYFILELMILFLFFVLGAGQNGSDTKALPYLKGELERVFMREKTCREELWINGIVRSSFMPPKSHPEFVGTEEVYFGHFLLLFFFS